MTTISRSLARRARRTSLLTAAAVLTAASLLSGCGKKDKAATQTAAKVNKEEITVHQINYVLQQQRGLPPAQAASSSQAVLERLIDQELAVQKATDQRLDREPAVMQRIEMARRDILAKAYADRIGSGAAQPTDQDIAAYYSAHPDLFSARRIYNLVEVGIDAQPAQVEALKAQLAAMKSFPDFIAYLKDNGYKYVGNDVVRPAEQLPLAYLGKLAAMTPGQALTTPRPGGLTVFSLVRSQLQPVTEQQAKQAIARYLLNERKRKLVNDDLQALRASAKIEYMGQFAANAAAAPAAAASEGPPVMSLTPTLPASEVSAAPQLEASSPDASSSTMPSDETLDKGLKGLK